MMTNFHRIDFTTIKNMALRNCQSLVQSWLPDGYIKRNEYVARNPKRNDQNLGSFRINLNTGKWADFATGDHGGDLIALYAYLNGLTQFEAAVELTKKLGGR